MTPLNWIDVAHHRANTKRLIWWQVFAPERIQPRIGNPMNPTDEAVERLTKALTPIAGASSFPRFPIVLGKDVRLLLTERTRHIAALEALLEYEDAAADGTPHKVTPDGPLRRDFANARAALNPTGEK